MHEPVRHDRQRDAAVVDRIVARAIEVAAREDRLSPAAVTVLMRRYVATGHDVAGAALAGALTAAVDQQPSAMSSADRARWLSVFVEAASIAEDERIQARAADLAASLASEWPSRGDTATAMQGAEACLRWAIAWGVEPSGLSTGQRTPALVDTIDELERIVGHVYEPGEGVRHIVGGRGDDPGTLDDHLSAASALLTAHRTTARLPYSMLAEELTRFAERSWWNDALGVFEVRVDASLQPVPELASDSATVGHTLLNCRAVHVLCGLSLLHGDPDYRAAAVVAPDADDRRSARRILDALATRIGAGDITLNRGDAEFANAFEDWLALR